MTKRLRVNAERVDGGDGCYTLTISSQSYGIRLGDESGDYVDVTPAMWIALVAAVEVVDVPTPYERVRDALREEDIVEDDETCARIAARLGITEGE